MTTPSAPAPHPGTAAYRKARDTLVRLSGQHDRAVAEFRWPDVGDRFNWAVDWFDAVARGNDRLALWIVEQDGSEQQITYDEMATRSDQVAVWLSDLGVGKGDRVLLMLGNQVELWETMLAVAKLGAVIMPTTAALGPGDLRDRVDRGGARVVVASAADTAKFAEVPGDYLRIVVGGGEGWHDYADSYAAQGHRFAGVTAATDPLLVYFTSGTTSRPKLVEHTQVSYPVGHLSTMYWIGARPGDVHLAISSPGWAKHAWSCFFAPWIAEATIFVHNYARFDATVLLEQIRRAGVTTFCAPPTVWRMLIQADLAGGSGSLRELLAAGEPLNPEVISQVEKAWGLTIRDGYGQTETTLQIGNIAGERLKPGSMGRPMPGVPVALVDPLTGEEGDEGEIVLDLSKHPVNLMTGYLGDVERQNQAMEGGWYHTGDVAQRDADGYITYIGRTDDVFKASDYKISPFELESVLIEHPAVAEAAVVPAPDATRLAVPKAYVALAAGWEPDAETAKAILAHAREHLAPYLRVRRVEFFELPKTISGKIRRVELRDRERHAFDSGKSLSEEFRDDQFPELKGPS
ncbi:MAG: AMP-binding protein [Pedococcus sp.]